jgi:hypothetical protein
MATRINSGSLVHPSWPRPNAQERGSKSGKWFVLGLSPTRGILDCPGGPRSLQACAGSSRAFLLGACCLCPCSFRNTAQPKHEGHTKEKPTVATDCQTVATKAGHSMDNYRLSFQSRHANAVVGSFLDSLPQFLLWLFNSSTRTARVRSGRSQSPWKMLSIEHTRQALRRRRYAIPVQEIPSTCGVVLLRPRPLSNGGGSGRNMRAAPVLFACATQLRRISPPHQRHLVGCKRLATMSGRASSRTTLRDFYGM